MALGDFAATSRTPIRLLLAGVCFVAMLTVGAQPAHAHRVGLSSGRFVSDGANVEVVVTLRRADLVRAVPALDKNGDDELADDELALSDAAAAEALAKISATRGATPCLGQLTKVGQDGPDGAGMVVRYEACKGDAPALTVDLAKLIQAMGTGHRHAAVFEVPEGVAKPADVLMHAEAAVVSVPLTTPSTSGGDVAPAPPPPQSHFGVAREYFVLGVEHIWTGIDHILFLLGLIMLGGRTKDLLATITAFTISHSVTLGLAVLGVVAPSPSLVEPIIALSVAYVGLENFFVKDTSKRWRIAAAFGLIHGFGFAGALGEVSLPRASIPVALATFNIGVEAGQLMLLTLIVPTLALLRKQAWFTPRGIWAVSGCIVAAGLVWFVERVAFA